MFLALRYQTIDIDFPILWQQKNARQNAQKAVQQGRSE
jgi:hypothetical protein